MSESEEAALKEAKSILRLHFDAFVVTTRTQDEDGSDRINTDWHGAISDVIGLNRITSIRVERIAIDRGGAP